MAVAGLFDDRFDLLTNLREALAQVLLAYANLWTHLVTTGAGTEAVARTDTAPAPPAS